MVEPVVMMSSKRRMCLPANCGGLFSLKMPSTFCQRCVFDRRVWDGLSISRVRLSSDIGMPVVRDMPCAISNDWL